MMHRVAAAFALSIALTPAGVVAQHQPAHSSTQRLRMTATAYCDKGKTDGGSVARRGLIAADPHVIPLGSVVRLEVASRRQYNGVYNVMDTGSAVKGHRVDIFMPSCPEAKKFGERPVIARVLKRSEPKRGDAGATRR